MAIKLERGQKGDVSTDHLVSKIVIGSGWNPTLETPDDFVIDMVVYGLDDEGYCRRLDDIIYFYNPVMQGDREEIIKHVEAEEIHRSHLIPLKDHEQVKILLDEVPLRIDSLLVCLGIYDSLNNKYNLSQVDNIHLQIFNEENSEIIIQNSEYPLKYFKKESCLIIGKLFRFGDYWRFHNISEGYIGDIGTLHGIYFRRGDEVIE